MLPMRAGESKGIGENGQQKGLGGDNMLKEAPVGKTYEVEEGASNANPR